MAKKPSAKVTKTSTPKKAAGTSKKAAVATRKTSTPKQQITPHVKLLR